jgi:hypothetical protein
MGLAVASPSRLLVADTYHAAVVLVPLDGATRTVPARGGSNGAYDVVVSNPYGSVTSSVANLRIIMPPLHLALDAAGKSVLSLDGPAFQTYNLNFADRPDGVSWNVIDGVTAGLDGHWSYTDPHEAPARFYRVLLP